MTNHPEAPIDPSQDFPEDPADEPPREKAHDIDDDNVATRPHGRRFGESQPRGRGRPPGAQNRSTILKRVAHKRHRIKIDGKRRIMTSIEMVLHMLRTEASRGNLQAFKLQDVLLTKYGSSNAPTRRAIIFLDHDLTEEEWLALYTRPPTPTEELLEHYPHLRDIIAERDEWLEWDAQLEVARAEEMRAFMLD